MNFNQELKFYQKIINQQLKRFFGQLFFPERGNLLVGKELYFLERFCLYPGKRIRPVLAIKTFQAFSNKNLNKFYQIFIALELYHSYTLIHDDIYDEDVIRRGKKTIHALFEEWFDRRYQKFPYFGKIYKSTASRFGVVSGFIGGKTLRALVDLAILHSKIDIKKKIKILEIFNRQDFLDNFGQAEDLFFEKEKRIDENDYFRMVKLKTGGLFRASVCLAGILSEADEKKIKILEDFVERLAYIFQIKDDLLDLSIGGEKGREKGSDIRNGKKTLLLIYSLKRACKKQKTEMLKIIGNEKASKKEVQKIIDFYHKSGAVDFCEKVASEELKKSLRILEKLKGKINNSYDFFESFAYFMFKRNK